MSTTRIEAFSDGVIAIAITLLVLDLNVPNGADLHGRSLLHFLGTQWPSYAAYATTFAVVGIVWVNHHAVFLRCDEADRLLLLINLFLLATVSVLPFSTALLAEYVREGGYDAHVAAAIYGATLFSMSIGFSLLAMRINGRWSWRFSIGLVLYAATIGLAFVDAIAALAVHAAIAAYYVVDRLPVDGEEQPSPAA